MNKDIFINGVLITLVFAILYYLESRFVSKREINLKEIVKYSLIVYISYFCVFFISDFVSI